MARRLSKKESEALRRALARAPRPAPEAAGRAKAALSPDIARAARALRERRRLRLQAAALAGCTAAFLGLAVFLYRFRVLVVAPGWWVPLAAVGALGLAATACLPLLIGKKKGEG